MPEFEQNPQDPRIQLEKRLSFLTTLVHPADDSKANVVGFRCSLEGVSTDEQRRESLKIVNSAIAAIRGAKRLKDSRGITERYEMGWRRSFPSDNPNACVEFTVILR